MLGYVLLEIWLAAKFSLWRSDLVKPTLIWLVSSGVVLLFDFDKASKEPHFFRRKATEAIGIAAFLEFFMNLSTLDLIGEILLQPLAALLVGISALTGKTDQDRIVKKLADGILALIGISLLTFTIQHQYSTWSETDKYSLVLQLALPIWLTVWFLPFIYFLSLYANYDSAFSRIDWATSDRNSRRRAKLALISKLHFRLGGTHAFAGYWPEQIASAPDFASARQAVAQFQQSQRDAKRAIIEEEERLRRYAGSNETDAKGRRLDRREFWRRTVTGWCFAIGAAGPPPDQWEYDGSDPPCGFPGKDQLWGTGAFSNSKNLNWSYT
ncbi:MAG: hypothetical protein HYY66_03285 [Candidatus Tectomicrobia bacterium]|nr:hypothetical protein [Candidatus Tectomicrobia bacterium]